MCSSDLVLNILVRNGSIKKDDLENIEREAERKNGNFFDILKGKEELRFYGLYNTAIDSSHFVSRLFPSLILLFFPFKFIFIFYGLAMFVFFLFSLKVKNIVEKNRKSKRG